MAETVIDRNELTKYEEKVSSLEYAIKSVSGEQGKTINALVNFLKEYLGSIKYPKEAIDEQNLYFSKQHAENIVALIKKYVSFTSETVNSYVSAAVNRIDFKDFLFSESDVSKFKKKIEEKLKGIFDELAIKKDESEKTEQKTKTKDSSSTQEVQISDVKKYIAKTLYIPKLNLSKITNFLNRNVFQNIWMAVGSKQFSFDSVDKIILTKTKKSSLFFKKIWNPTVSDLRYPFERFERNATSNLIHKTKATVINYSKKFFKALDSIFPVAIVFGVLRFGFSFIKKSVSFAVKTIKSAIRLVSKTVKFVTSTIKTVFHFVKRVGSKTIHLLKRTITKIVSSKAFKLTSKALIKFFSLPIGAYILGFIIGRIYKKIKDLLALFGGFGNILEKIKTKFTSIKNWVNDNIVVPYIDPILNWLDRRKTDADFTITQVKDVFSDTDGDLLEKIKETSKLFIVTDQNGNKLISARDLTKKINEAQEIIRSIANFDFAKFAVVGGGKLLGGIIGAKLGAAAGQALIPIPVVGAVIGALLGGWAGDALGGVIGEMIMATSPYENAKKEEDAVQEYIRKNFGYSGNVRGSSLYERPSASRHISLLKSLGNAAEGNLDLENSGELVELEKFGINLTTQLKDKRSETRENLKLLQYIDKLSYSNIHSEIAETIDSMQKLLEKSSGEKKRGFFSYGDVLIYDKNFNNTKIFLGNGTTKLNYNDVHYGNRGINPYWFKIFRDIAILSKLREFEANLISPLEFVGFMNEITNNRINVKSIVDKYFKDFSITFNNNSSPLYLNANSLITGEYFWGNNGYLKEQYKRDWNRYFKTVDPNKNNYPYIFVGYQPLDDGWHILSKRLIEKQDFGDIIIKNARRSAYKYEASDINGFSDLYDEIYKELFGEHVLGLEKLDQNEIAFRFRQQIGKSGDALDEEDKKLILRQLMLGAVSESSEMFIETALKTFGNAIDSISSPENLSEDEFKKALEGALANSQNENGLIITLGQYVKMCGDGNDFYKNRLIPALRDFISKHVPKEKQSQMYTILKLPPPIEGTGNSASDFAGKPVDPSIQQ